jgi:RNA polymerase sigma factor (sigma-70 family)
MASQRQQRRRPEKERSEVLEQLMRRHRQTLIRQAGFHSESTADADDALSDASVQFLRHFPGEHDREALLWMQVVVKRCAWRIAETRRRRGETVEEIAVDLADERRGPAQLAEATDEVERFLAALACLRPDERRVLVLIAAGYSYAEIARICDWTLTKINRCATEGRVRLRGVLKGGG